MIALRQQFRMADLNRPQIDVLRDVVVILCGGAQDFFELRLMDKIGHSSSARRLSAIVFGRMHDYHNRYFEELESARGSRPLVNRLIYRSCPLT
jgi:hypothetical protein